MVVAGALAALYLHILAIRSDWLAVTLGAFGFYVVAVVFVLWPPRMLSQQAAGQSASSTPPTDIPKSRPIRLVPSVEALMFLKAMICIGIGLQLSYPAVGVLPQYLAPEIEASSPDISLCSPTANDSSPNIVRWPNPLNRTLYETDEETNTICPVDPETATAVTSEEVAAAITGEATLSGQGADESVQQLFTPFGSWFQDESLWAVLIFFVFAALYFLEYEWIARPYISQRQVQSLDRGPRRSYLYQHDLDPVWIAEEKSNCEKRRLAKGLGPTAEDKKHEMNMRLRRLELYRKPRFRAFEISRCRQRRSRNAVPTDHADVGIGAR